MEVLPPPPLPAQHWQRLRTEAARAADEVPAYAGRAAPPPEATPAAVSRWLASMPLCKKRDLRRGFPKSMLRKGQDLRASMERAEVEIIATSGTSADRLQILWEWTWWDPQERQAMRLNPRIAAVMPVDRSTFREAVLTTPVCGGATCHVGQLSREERTIDGMLFLNQVPDPTHFSDGELDRMVAEWNALRPDGVEADPAYLAALCRHVARRGEKLHSPSYITLTYEQTTRAHKRAIAAVLDSPLYQLYGATEAGVLFMENSDGKLVHNSAHSHIELVDRGGGLAGIVVTTLGREWMPLLRYDIGDLVRLDTATEHGFVLARVEGRLCDAIEGKAGLLSPAMLDDIVDAAEPGQQGWQLTETPEHGWALRIVGSDGIDAARALADAIGAAIQPTREAALQPEGSGKFRLVRHHE